MPGKAGGRDGRNQHWWGWWWTSRRTSHQPLRSWRHQIHRLHLQAARIIQVSIIIIIIILHWCNCAHLEVSCLHMHVYFVCRPGWTPLNVALSHVNYSIKALPAEKKNPSIISKGEWLGPLASSKLEKFTILDDVSFYLKPGEMTLLLGAPGATLNSTTQDHQLSDDDLSWITNSGLLTGCCWNNNNNHNTNKQNEGCGKSTLFRLIANRLQKGKAEGELTFNGRPPIKKHYHRDVAYITQEDTHIGTTTTTTMSTTLSYMCINWC